MEIKRPSKTLLTQGITMKTIASALYVGVIHSLSACLP